MKTTGGGWVRGSANEDLESIWASLDKLGQAKNDRGLN